MVRVWLCREGRGQYMLDGTAYYRIAHSVACSHGNCYIDRFF
jgi:hypothetical protein